MEEMSDEELRALTNAIKIRYGYDFTNYEMKSLKRGFTRLIAKHQLGSLLGLWSKVLKDRSFMLSCMDDLTVNLTELFRNPEVWVKIKDEVGEFSKTHSQVNFWHAGCSTGEEIYTMAIILSDLGILSKVKTLATDLSGTVLEKAIAGEYSMLTWKKYLESFHKYFPNGDQDKYFELTEDLVKMKPNLKNHVEFRKHDLVQDPMNTKYDFIFCRNVMIYFDDQLKMKVLQLFHSALNDDGYFIIGYYDMLPESSKSLFELHDPVTRIYKKVKKQTVTNSNSQSESVHDVLERLRRLTAKEESNKV